MPEIEVVLQGLTATTNQGALSYCSVSLVRGERLTLVDVAYQGRRDQIIERLDALGLTPGDIERVVLTHSHWDHALNLLQFPNAEVILHEDEYAYCHEPHEADWATPRYVSDVLARCRSVTTVRDGEELEPGVRLAALPGHSPGSMGVLVETAEGIHGIVGDALPSRAAARADVPSARLVFWDAEEAERSARKVLDTCRLVYPGHDRPFRIEAGAFRYVEPQSLVVMNAPRDEDGSAHAEVEPEARPFVTIVEPSARPRR